MHIWKLLKHGVIYDRTQYPSVLSEPEANIPLFHMAGIKKDAIKNPLFSRPRRDTISETFKEEKRWQKTV